jgi:integrase
MGSVYLRGAVWWCKYRDENGRIRRIALRSVAGKTEALRLVRELERNAERVRLGLEAAPAPSITVEEAWKKYDAAVTEGQESANSTRGRFKLHILPVLGSKPLSHVRPADVSALLTSLRGRLSPQSRAHVRRHLIALFNFAADQMGVFKGKNPAAEAPAVAVPKRRIRYLTEAQLVALERAAGRFWPLFKFSALSGLRKGEVCGLLWASVDLDHRIIYVERSYAKDTTKGKKARVVAIHRDLLADLEEMRKHATGPLVFPDDNGRMRTKDWDAAGIFKSVLIAAGLIEGYRLVCRRKGCGYASDVRPQKSTAPCPRCAFALWPVAVPVDLTFKHLRSTWGTRGYRATGDMRFVQAGLGHADIKTTEDAYAALLTEHLHSQTEKVPSLGTGLGTTPAAMQPDTKKGAGNVE